MTRPVAPCRWFELTTADHATLICWSAAEALPLVILGAAGLPFWRVASLDHRPAPARLYQPNAAGYVLNNAREEISGD